MTDRTEWLELRDAIELAGRLIFATDWTGSERFAPTQSELNTEITRLHELTPDQIGAEYAALHAWLEAQAERERAASEAAGTRPSGTREGLEKLRAELATLPAQIAAEAKRERAARKAAGAELSKVRERLEKLRAHRRGVERTIEKLSAELAKPVKRSKTHSRSAHEQREFVIDVLSDRIEKAYQPGLAARGRWYEAHAAIDDQGRAGRIRARAHRPARSPVPFGAERWAEIFPPPGETHGFIDGIPTTVALAQFDLETIFAPEPAGRSATRRRPPAPQLQRVEAEMANAINEGRETRESLQAMTEEAMHAQYLASRDTCRRARQNVLSRVVAP